MVVLVADLPVPEEDLEWVQEVAAQWAVLAAARCEGAVRVEGLQAHAAAPVVAVPVPMAVASVAAVLDGN